MRYVFRHTFASGREATVIVTRRPPGLPKIQTKGMSELTEHEAEEYVPLLNEILERTMPDMTEEEVKALAILGELKLRSK